MKTNLTTVSTLASMEDRLLTTREAAIIAAMAPGTLAKARVYGSPGFPPFVRIGGKAIRYRLSSLVAWLEAQTEYIHTSQK